MPELEILTTNRFYLELKLDGSVEPVDAYFMECQGFKRTQEVIEVCEVTPQKWGKAGTTVGRVVRTKVPGNVKSNNLILRRGMTSSITVWNWFNEVEQGGWAKQRKNGDLVIYNQGSEEQARFRFLGGWPTSFKISDVKAGGKDFAIEEMELAVEEFTRVK